MCRYGAIIRCRDSFFISHPPVGNELSLYTTRYTCIIISPVYTYSVLFCGVSVALIDKRLRFFFLILARTSSVDGQDGLLVSRTKKKKESGEKKGVRSKRVLYPERRTGSIIVKALCRDSTSRRRRRVNESRPDDDGEEIAPRFSLTNGCNYVNKAVDAESSPGRR